MKELCFSSAHKIPHMICGVHSFGGVVVIHRCPCGAHTPRGGVQGVTWEIAGRTMFACLLALLLSPGAPFCWHVELGFQLR